ncbi:MAG: type II toxin-antitoxin system PemK/MazF family toxin [Deltaproteobacteria bacterium]|nr:type II toxin-antitoxin system PemK/MazF family toxin [Deltaproteobacteria bacterium]
MEKLIFRRGDIITCALSGDYGKPRPAILIQSDLFNETHASITVCPLTTHLVESPLFRLSVVPSPENGLKKPSQIMADKISTIKASRAKSLLGVLNQTQMENLNRAIALWLDLDLA